MSNTTMTVRPSFGINFLLFFVHFFNLYFENAFLLRNNKHMLTLKVLRFIHFLKTNCKGRAFHANQIVMPLVILE